MKHHLLQKCSFFLIKLAAFQARGAACMKLRLRQNGMVFNDYTDRFDDWIKQRTAEYRTAE
jgi:hypothetical protein